MPLIPCPKCGAKFDVTSFTPGKKLRCSKCKEVFAVPTAAAEPVPAAVSKDGTRTSIKKKSSQVVAKPPAEEPAKRPSKMLRPPKPAAEPEPEPAESDAPPQGKKKAILAIVGIVVLVGGGAAFFAGPGGDDSSAMTETYEQHVAKIKNPTADDQAKLALWCLGHKDLAHAEDHLGQALAAGSKAKQLTEAATAVYWRKRFDVPATDIEKRLNLAEWCGKYGLDALRKLEANRVLAVDKTNKRAQEILGAVSATTGDGKEPEVDLDAELAAKRKREAEDAAKMASMDEWHKKSYKHCIDLRSGKQLGEKFACCDAEPPFSVLVEASDKYKAEDVAKEYHTALKGLWDVFQKEIAAKLKLEHLDTEPYFVHVFAGRARYDENANREQMFMRPDGYIKNWLGLGIWTWYEGKVNKPYLWHDGAHLLYVAASNAKGGQGKSTWWVNDGLAFCFEAAAKLGKDTIGGIDPDRLPTIQAELKLDPGKRRIMSIGSLAGKQSSEIVPDLKNPTGSDEEKFAREKKAEAYFAQAWSLVAWFLTPEHREKFEALLDRELSGKGGLSAFTEVMAGDPVESSWEKFVQESK